MSRAEWELVEMARARALADRYEREALESAAAHGCVGVQAQQAYALGWLAMRCADRQVRLEAKAAMTRGELIDDLWRALPAGSRSPKLLGAFADAMIAAGLDWTPAHSDTLAAILGSSGLKAAERTAPAMPKDAARAHDAAGPATPPPPRPQGVAGFPQAGPAREWDQR